MLRLAFRVHVEPNPMRRETIMWCLKERRKDWTPLSIKASISDVGMMRATTNSSVGGTAGWQLSPECKSSVQLYLLESTVRGLSIPRDETFIN
jgi:hypothetical protein